MSKFRHKYTLPAILVMLGVVLAILIFSLVNFKKHTTLPQNANTSVIGVELNQSLPDVDLHKLQGNGVSFVYLRSTQGRTYFDDDYLIYRDQVLGTKLAFGTVVAYSDESTPLEHYRYFTSKVGSEVGQLPIMIIPAVANRSRSYLKAMAQFVTLLNNDGKKVIVVLNERYHKYFPENVALVATDEKNNDREHYAFWRYTTVGRVNHVKGLESGVTMFAYNGSIAQYKQKYGQLTQ